MADSPEDLARALRQLAADLMAALQLETDEEQRTFELIQQAYVTIDTLNYIVRDLESAWRTTTPK